MIIRIPNSISNWKLALRYSVKSKQACVDLELFLEHGWGRWNLKLYLKLSLKPTCSDLNMTVI